MYAGKIVEQGSTAQVLETPAHPYTRGLLDSTPAAASAAPDAAGHARPLRPIAGMAPSLRALPAGCPFRPRCPRASAACEQPPPVVEMAPGHTARCFHPLTGKPAEASQ
jgi:peptide/nickel transport system ATP-binding protein